MSKDNVINTLVDAADPMVDRLASGAREAVDKMADVAAQAGKTLDEKGEQLRELQVRWLDNSRTYIRDNPVKALGIAGIAIVGGFLLSRLLSSR